MRLFALAIAALLTTAATAQAGIVMTPQPAAKSAQVCYISGNFANRARAASDIGGMKSCDGIGKTEAFIGFKVLPMSGRSTTPIIHQFGATSVCYFMTNASNNAYFVPAGSQADWNAFTSSVNAGRLAGVKLTPCTSSIGDGQGLEPIKDLCGGKLSTDGTYANGFNALSNVPADGSAYRYSVVDAKNEVLRTLTAYATPRGWQIDTKDKCPTEKEKVASNGTSTKSGGTAVNASAVNRLASNAGTVQTPVVRTASAAPAAALPPATFTRTGTTATVPATRVFITDGATMRHIY